MLTKEKFNELYKIGVVGFSDENKMHPDTYTLLANLIKQICETDVKKNSFVFVGGYTNTGINRILYDCCKTNGVLIGAICSGKHKEYECWPDVDYLEVIGNEWGDESESFVNSLDLIIRIDGGEQSHSEILMAKEKDLQVEEFDLV